MADLIDRQALMTKLRREPIFEKTEFDKTLFYVEKSIIAEMPTVDAVPVVRCKDCKWWDCYGDDESHKGECLELELDCCMYEDDFCSYGEKREQNG